MCDPFKLRLLIFKLLLFGCLLDEEATQLSDEGLLLLLFNKTGGCCCCCDAICISQSYEFILLLLFLLLMTLVWFLAMNKFFVLEFCIASAAAANMSNWSLLLLLVLLLACVGFSLVWASSKHSRYVLALFCCSIFLVVTVVALPPADIRSFIENTFEPIFGLVVVACCGLVGPGDADEDGLLVLLVMLLIWLLLLDL